jgi:hypothetical protein
MFGDDYHRSLEHIGGAGGERRQGDRGTDIAEASCCHSLSILAHGSGRGNLAPWWWLQFKEPPVSLSLHSEQTLLKGERPGQTNTNRFCKTRLFDFLFALYLFHFPVISYKTLGLRKRISEVLEYHNKLATLSLF